MAVPQELEIDKINAITRNLKEGDQEDKEFERRMRVAETLLKEKAIEGKTNVNDATRDAKASRSNQQQLQEALRPSGPVGTGSQGFGSQGGGTQ